MNLEGFWHLAFHQERGLRGRRLNPVLTDVSARTNLRATIFHRSASAGGPRYSEAGAQIWKHYETRAGLSAGGRLCQTIAVLCSHFYYSCRTSLRLALLRG